MPTDPIHRFVSALAVVPATPTALATALDAARRPDFSWPAACELAARNAVLAALASSVAEHPGFDPPSPVRTQLGLATIAARTCSATCAADLAPVFARWTQHRLSWGLMKGAALIASSYPDNARLLNDIDVLVAPRDYPQARAALIDAGFTPATGPHGEQTMLALKEQVVFSGGGRHGAAATRVDLHREVYGPSKPYRFDPLDVLSRCSHARLCGQNVFVLDPADLLLHLATQLLNDRLLVRLLRLADLATLLARVDPGECDRRATATRSAAAVAVARAAVRAVFPEQTAGSCGVQPGDARATAVVRALIARGWPWAGSFEAGRLPETYRRAAAAVAGHGFRPAIVDGVRAAGAYRSERRASGASMPRSLLGAARMTAAGLAAFATLRWEMHAAQR